MISAKQPTWLPVASSLERPRAAIVSTALAMCRSVRTLGTVSPRAATAMPPDANTGTATSESPGWSSQRETATRVSLMLARHWRSRSGSVSVFGVKPVRPLVITRSSISAEENASSALPRAVA